MLQVGQLANPVDVYTESTLLRSALPELEQGRPVLIERQGQHYLVLPRAAVGQRPTRRLDDLPLREIDPMPATTSVSEALEHMDPDAPGYLAITKADQVVGLVSRENLLAQVAADASSGGASRDRMVMLGEFAGAIAHDFNNLLTVTLGRLSILARGQAEGSRERGHVDEITRATNRAAKLIRQLLAFGSRELVQPVVLDLHSTLTQLEELLTRLVGEDIDLQFDIDPELWPVDADPVQIERVLANLVVNARHAMPEGGKLTVRAINRNIDGHEYVRISVEDTGVGMAPDVVKRIFEPYFTTRRGRGSGLGLATVHGTVAQLGGTIAVESTPGIGTRFDIDLDVTDADDSVEPVIPFRAVPALEGKASVLVVEDEPGVARATRRLLQMLGHDAVIVDSVADAKAHFATTPPPDTNVVLTDMVLRQGRGNQLVAWLKQHHPAIRTIITSGYIGAAEADIDDADAVLPKPFSPEQLEASLARAFAARR